MEVKVSFKNQIQERTLEELKLYFQPKVFMEYCKACQYYNKIWSCPPYNFDLTEMLDRYQYAYIIGSKVYIDDLEEDLKQLSEDKNLEVVTNEIYKAAREVLDARLNTIAEAEKDLCVLLAGGCMECDCCTREIQLPCTRPEKLHYSLESIGFDVATISEEVLGDKILWAKESLPEYIILVCAIFSQEKLDIEGIYDSISHEDFGV